MPWGAIAHAGAVVIYLLLLGDGCASHSGEGLAMLDKARAPHAAVLTPISSACLLLTVRSKHQAKDEWPVPSASGAEEESFKRQDSAPSSNGGMGLPFL